MKTLAPFHRLLNALVLALGLSPFTIHAQLLTATAQSQLEAWLNQGNLNLSNIFTGTVASTTQNWHAAVDAQGPTFTLLRVIETSTSHEQVVGGYNPQSWNSSSGWTFTLPEADRTAFIFNLTHTILQRQNLIGEGLAGSGTYQTYNSSFWGPSFGGGYDLYTDMTVVTGQNDSYGGTSFGESILRFSNGASADPASQFRLLELETYTLSSASVLTPVPEPSTYGLMGVTALVGYAAWRRRKLRSVAA